MTRKIPSSDDHTIVTNVFQRSDVSFYWTMMHKQLTASKGNKLPCTVPIRKHRFLEEQNSSSTSSNRYRKSLVSPPSKLGGNKKIEKKESGSAEKITRHQKSSTKKNWLKDTGSSPERTIVICVVSIVWAIVVITYPFFQDAPVLATVSTTFGSVLAYLGIHHFGNKKQ